MEITEERAHEFENKPIEINNLKKKDLENGQSQATYETASMGN